MRRLLPLAAAAVLVVGAAGGYAYHRHSQHARCVPIITSLHVANPGGKRVVVVGDSWVTGYLLGGPEKSYAYLLARQAKWNADLLGVNSVGYKAEGFCAHRPLAARVPSIPTDADTVIVELGLNDAIYNLPDLPAAASSGLALLHQHVPHARLVVLGLPETRMISQTDRTEADAALRAAASTVGASFVALDVTLPLQSDGLHPTVAGDAELARFLRQPVGPLAG